MSKNFSSKNVLIKHKQNNIEFGKGIMDIQKQFDNLQNKNRQLDAGQIIQKNKVKQIKEDAMKQLLIVLKNNGVDLSDQESINSFLELLESENPDLKIIFEMVFNSLSQDEENNLLNNNQQDENYKYQIRANTDSDINFNSDNAINKQIPAPISISPFQLKNL